MLLRESPAIACPTCGETPCGGGQMEDVKSGVVQCDHCDYATMQDSEGRTLRDGSPCPQCNGEG